MPFTTGKWSTNGDENSGCVVHFFTDCAKSASGVWPDATNRRDSTQQSRVMVRSVTGRTLALSLRVATP